MAGGSLGYATLPVVPSFRGFGGGLAKQISAPLRSAGSVAGAAGGQAAGGGFTKGIGRAVAGTGKVLAGVVGGGLAVGIGAVGVVAGTAFSKGLDRAISIQNAQAKLTGLGHSQQTVTKIMDNALASVRGTAFGLGDAAGVAAGAVAAGIKPGQELQRTLSLVADSATIAGTDMGSMGSIFNKVAASGKLQGDVIAQLQDAGVPVLQFVAKEIGKTAAETSKLASEGKIDFATFSNAMEAGLGGAALSSGKTAQGAWANVQAALGRLGVSFLSGAVSTAPTLFTSISNATDRASAALAPYATIINTKVAAAMSSLAGYIDKVDFDVVVSRVAGFVSSVGAKLGEVRSLFANAFSGSGGAVDPSKIFGNLGAIGNVIQPLMPIFVSLGQAIGSISGSIGQLIGSGIQVLPPLITVLSGALQFLADHSELIGPLLLGITVALVAFRSAQAAANVAELGALPIKAANVAATLASANANRQLAAQMAIANGQQVASRVAMLPATAQVLLNTTALVANRVAMVASRVAMGIATAAQWAWNAALSANPIGIIIVAIAALVAGLIWFFTQTKLGQQIWSGFISWLQTAWTAVSTFFTGLWNGIVSVFQTAWNIVVAVVTTQVNMVRTVVLAVVGAISAWWSATWSAVSAAARAVWSGIVGFVTAYVGAVRSVVLTVVGALRAGWSATWSAISTAARAVWSGIVGFVTAYINTVRSIVTNVVNAIRSTWSAGWSAVSSAVRSAVSLVVSIVSGMVSSVSGAISNVVGFFRGIQGQVLGALAGAGSWLVSVGRNIIQGLISGLRSMGSSILSAVTGPIKDAIAGAKNLLGIRSPSRVFRQIGDYVGQGLVQGLKGSVSGVQAAARRMSNAVGSAFEARQLSETSAHNTYLAINAGTSMLESLAGRRDRIADQLTAANKKLKSAEKAYTDFRTSAAQSLGSFDVTKAQTGPGIVSALQTRLADVKKFTSVMTQLRKKGLDSTSYKQFIAAGVDALPLASNLLAGGSAQIKQVSSLQGQLSKASSSFATSAATDLYGAGVNAAKGLVRGLQSQNAAIAKQMQRVAATMVSTVKRALGIHSPSRVFYGLGSNTGQGYINAVSSMIRPAQDAMRRLVSTRSIDVPELELASDAQYRSAVAAVRAARAATPVAGAAATAAAGRSTQVTFTGPVGLSPEAVTREMVDRVSQSQQLASFDLTEVLP